MPDELKTYNEALEQAKNELALLRTQKSTEAKKTLAEYEARIPQLEARVKELLAKIAELEKAIADRNERLRMDEMNWRGHYENALTKVESEYSAKTVKLNSLMADLEKKQENFRHTSGVVEESLKAREGAVERKKKELEAIEHDLNIKAENLASEKSEFLNMVNEKDKEIAGMKDKASYDLEEAARIRGDAQKFLDDAKAKQSAVDAILNQKEEIERRLKAISGREETNEKRSAELNEQNVFLQAERARLNRRSSELNDKENRLKQREDNIKEIEAKVV